MMSSNFPADQNAGGNSAASGRDGINPRLILFGIVAAISAVFFLRNGEVTKIDFMFFEWDTTIRWSILMAIVLGILLDRLFSTWWRRRRKNNDDR
jgi:uncharacterized integral membrane protein